MLDSFCGQRQTKRFDGSPACDPAVTVAGFVFAESTTSLTQTANSKPVPNCLGTNSIQLGPSWDQNTLICGLTVTERRRCQQVSSLRLHVAECGNQGTTHHLRACRIPFAHARQLVLCSGLSLENFFFSDGGGLERRCSGESAYLSRCAASSISS